MSFRICLDGGMILLTPTIEKMIFLSSTCAIVFLCFNKGTKIQNEESMFDYFLNLCRAVIHLHF